MNREILFRAKRKDNGEWVEGYYIYYIKRTICLFGDSVKPEDEQHVIMQDGFSDWNMPRGTVVHEIDQETLCQYTGLTDKNGKKIWENDIVRYTFDYPSETATENGLKERISSVFWSEWRGSWSVYADERKGKGMNNDLFKYARNGNTVEIIGNIFDNPELLEVE